MKKLLVAFFWVMCSASISFAASKATCPNKVLDEGIIEGVYTGFDCGDLCYGTLRLDDEEDFSFLMGEENAEKWFGDRTGQRVSVSYVVRQFWLEGPNQCIRKELAVAVKALSGPAPAAQTADSKAPSGQGARPTGKTHTNSIGMQFVLIPAGSFHLDINIVNEFNEKLYNPKMTISKPFYLGVYEVTQEQWMAVMGNNPANFKGRTNPVENVSWDDVQEFIKRLNAKEGHSRYRLPTGMEWEYAARGGTNTLYFFMKDPKTWEEAERPLNDYAWFTKNSGRTTHPVGQKKPNPYGLYDIYGNVWEWVQDWSGDLPTDKEVRDYRGPNGGSDRVERGGGWNNNAKDCRSADRFSVWPGRRDSALGFRLALSPE